MGKSLKNALSVIPLGGISEIGKNMLVLEYSNEIIIIDSGLKFPSEDLPGVDLVIPNTTYLRNNRDKIKGIILTHGHEDHIGSLPFTLPDIDAPVYGTLLTLGLAERKMLDRNNGNGTKNTFSFNVINPEERLKLGCFKIDFFRVNHSIPDGVGLAIETPAGLVVHSGDFKIDQTPVDGKVIELNKIARYGERGVLLFICDTTNIHRKGYTPSEKVVGKTLLDVFARSTQRIIVTTFASNVHRVQQIINAAVCFRRKVALSGRSMVNVVEVSAELGYLQIPPNTLIEIDQARNLPPDKVVIITTGSQGEPMAALTRMAQKSHRQVQIQPGDTVIISASPIPGNEKLVTRTIDNLFRIGAQVIYTVDGDVHVSGHASREEIKVLINMLKPKYVMPFHGEYRHQAQFAKLAANMGIPENNVLKADLGERWEFRQKKAKLNGKVTAGEVMVDGLGVGDVGHKVLHDRQALSTEGVIIVLLAVGRKTSALLSGPEIVSRGFVYVKENMRFLDEAKALIATELNSLKPAQFESRPFIKEVVNKVLTSFIYKQIGRRPVILPVVIECPEE